MNTLELNDAIRAITGLKVEDIPRLKDTVEPLECPVCHDEIVAFPYDDDYWDRIQKVKDFTLAQLVSLVRLQRRSGLSFNQILDKTVNYGDYLGVSDFHGMFIGIEKDGYTHS